MPDVSSVFPPAKPSLLERSDADAILPVSIGTVAWTVALVVLLLVRDQLDEAGNGWWIRVAAAGAVLGLGGLVFLFWRRPGRRTGRRHGSAVA